MPARRDGGHRRRPKRQRLARSADFDRVFREGRSHASRHLVLHAFPRAGSGSSGGQARAEAAREGASPSAPSGDSTREPIDALDDSRPRLGVSVGRKVGGAVERNRVKRLLREAFWAVAPDLPPGQDFVLVARPDAGDLARRHGAAGFEAALRELVDHADLAPSGPRLEGAKREVRS